MHKQIQPGKAGLHELQVSSTKSQGETSNKTAIPRADIAGIFKIFTARYLHKFTSAIDGIEGVAVSEWRKGLTGLSLLQIAQGLERWKEDWPPSMDEFVACCKGKQVNGFGLDYTPECYRQTDKSRLLSSDARDMSQAENLKHLRAMREELKI